MFWRRIVLSPTVYFRMEFIASISVCTIINFSQPSVSAPEHMPVVSTGNNENFQPVPLIGQDGTPLSTKGYTEVRAYDLLTIGDTLYAIVRLDENLQAYKYDNGSFVYHSDLRYKLVGSAISYLPVIEKAVLSGTAFLTDRKIVLYGKYGCVCGYHAGWNRCCRRPSGLQ